MRTGLRACNQLSRPNEAVALFDTILFVVDMRLLHETSIDRYVCIRISLMLRLTTLLHVGRAELRAIND